MFRSYPSTWFFIWLVFPLLGWGGLAAGASVPEVSPVVESVSLLPKPPSRPRPTRAQVDGLIPKVASRYKVETALVRAVVAAESNYNAHAVSPAGAIGLMQLMPATAADYGVTSSDALFDPEVNLRTGTRHLKRLLNKYKNDYGRVIMAYNAGEGVVDRTNSRVTYLETLNYTEAVILNYRRHGGTAPTRDALRQVQSLRGMRFNSRSRRLLKKYLDPSLLSLKVKPTLDVHLLNPSLHDVGPESQPMFELDAGRIP
ncbi:lytic transglycosylase domain-containing protein [Thiorhodococcus fuscus]|uniref:Lytic transglycosylase domain-containing protein n=1 Tax=Thiorhodococcus fuscus TaxID=527200 RepID=A0ABW4YB98_9GAMM